MAERLTDTVVRGLPAPETGNRITYDSEVKGFGARVTAAGARSFILNYRTRGGRERRFTIGSFPDWKVAAARTEAADLKKRVDRGEDPMGDVVALRAAPTMAELARRFEEEFLPKKRLTTQADYRSIIAREILPSMKSLKVEAVDFSDIDELHRKITARGAKYRANRTVALLSKMFALSIRWKWRTDNPVTGVERNQEIKRQRYLTAAEIESLAVALAAYEDKQAADIIRLLLLTGARRGEALAAQWDQFDLEAGIWTKPGATTKQKTDHRIPLNAPALALVKRLREVAADDAVYLFPGRSKGHRVEINRPWYELCEAAGIVKAETRKDASGGKEIIIKPSARLHDLRHTFASILAGSGLSLPIIGALLGHTQPATTARYAHLLDDPLRVASERAGRILSGEGKKSDPAYGDAS